MMEGYKRVTGIKELSQIKPLKFNFISCLLDYSNYKFVCV